MRHSRSPAKSSLRNSTPAMRPGTGPRPVKVCEAIVASGAKNMPKLANPLFHDARMSAKYCSASAPHSASGPLHPASEPTRHTATPAPATARATRPTPSQRGPLRIPTPPVYAPTRPGSRAKGHRVSSRPPRSTARRDQRSPATPRWTRSAISATSRHPPNPCGQRPFPGSSSPNAPHPGTDDTATREIPRAAPGDLAGAPSVAASRAPAAVSHRPRATVKAEVRAG